MKKALWILLTVIFVLSIFQYTAMAVGNYSYYTDIKPLITAKECAVCHSWMELYNSITTKTFNMNGRELKLVDTAKPDSSVIIWRITGVDLSTGEGITKMPNGGPYYTENEIQIFKDWISQEAPYDVSVGVEDTHTWLEVKKKFK